MLMDSMQYPPVAPGGAGGRGGGGGGGALRGKHIDLVLMDCSMPVMDGCTATALIRKMEAEKGVEASVPIVALTAFAMSRDRVRCLQVRVLVLLPTPPFRQVLLPRLPVEWVLMPLHARAACRPAWMTTSRSPSRAAR